MKIIICLTSISLPCESFNKTGRRSVPTNSCLGEKHMPYRFLCILKQHFSAEALLCFFPDLYVNCTVLCWPGWSLPERGEMEKSLCSWIFIRWSSDGLKSPVSAQYSSSICWSSGNKNDLRETILIIYLYCRCDFICYYKPSANQVMDAHHSTGILPGFLNRSRILVGSEPRGAALKQKSIMAEVKMEGQCRKLQKVIIYIKRKRGTKKSLNVWLF